MSDLINDEKSKFVYILSSELESYKQGTIINFFCSLMPDESEIKISELKVVGIDKKPGNVVFLGLGRASWDTENIDDFLDIQLRMQRKLLELWKHIEKLLSDSGVSKERIDEIVAENEKPIQKLRDRFILK